MTSRVASLLVCLAGLAGCGDDGATTTTGLSATTVPVTTTGESATDATTTAVPTTEPATTEPATTEPATGSTTEPATTEPATTEPDTTTTETTGAPAGCGDGVMQDPEECDDGNQEDGDACTNACMNAACGDGILGPGEGCDDGNQQDDDDCTNECATASCGDGKLQVPEECDDGNMVDTDACLATCKQATCGDMAVQAGTEECDDGNMVDTDACIACKTAKCGDKLVQAGTEECDDGNMVDTDACLGTCKTAKCGDKVVQAGTEECDDGNMVDNDSCSNACKNVVSAATCKSIHMTQPNAPSGLFMIDPDGNGGAPAFSAYCDMTTDGGGWTLILNRNVNSDQTGQPDINLANGVFDNTRATNWNYDVDLFWTGATQFMFADKQNDNCNNCSIAQYDSAIRSEKPNVPAYSNDCPGNSAGINVQKIVGPQAGMAGTGYQCGASLGWGSCGGKNCHFGVHHQNTASDGQWSQNLWNEVHFPSAYSSYKSYGNYQQEPTAWCRSCGGGLAQVLNNSVTCCNTSQFNAKARFTVWAR